jgi:hypothetical protein
MPELAFITQIKDEPLALTIFGFLTLYKIIDILVKNIFPLIRKNKKKTVEEILAEIESRINSLVSAISDVEVFAYNISQGTLENMVFNEELPIFRRLKAFRRVIALKGNGRTKAKGIKLILENQEAWKDVLDIKMDLKIIDQKYYNETLDEIDKKIFDFSLSKNVQE